MKRLLKSLLKNRIGFGGAAISGEGGGYGFGDISSDDSIKLLHYVYERGVTLFDLAPIYGFQEAEKRVGKAFKNLRDNVFLVSKSGVSWHSSKRVNMSNDPKITQNMLEQSLRDLQTDYIDLYMVHWPDSQVDIRKPMEVLSKAKLQGKIRSIGLCNTYYADLIKAQEIDQIEAVQGELNIFSNWARDNLFDYLKQEEISFMAYGTFDKGIISGRVDHNRKYDSTDARSWAPWWKKSNKDQKIEKMEIIRPLLQNYNVSPVELAIGYNLSHEIVDVTLCGGRNQKQWEEIFSAKKNILPEDLVKQVREICES